MPDTKISDLTAASALTGAELMEVVQSGSNKKATALAVASLSAPSDTQMMLGGRPFMVIIPSWNATTVTAIGTGNSSTTVSTVSPATTNYFTRQRRAGYATAATAGSIANIQPTFRVSRVDGFEFVCRFGMAVPVSGQQILVGVTAAAPAGGANPSARTDAIFVGKDAADSNFFIMHNDSSGTCTRIDTGFSATSTATDYYEVMIICQPSGDASVKVTQLNTGTVFSSPLTTDLPTATTFLIPMMQLSNGATAAAATIHCSGLQAQIGV